MGGVILEASDNFIRAPIGFADSNDIGRLFQSTSDTIPMLSDSRPRTEISEPGQPFRLELLVEFDERGVPVRPKGSALGRFGKQMRIEPQQPMHLVEGEAIHPQEILDLLAGARGRPGTVALGPEGRVVHEVDHSSLPVQLLVVIGPHQLRAEITLRLAEVVGQTQVSAQPGVRQVVGERVSAEVGVG